MKQRSKYFYFHFNMEGFDVYEQGKLIPRFVLFIRGYNSIDLLNGKTHFEIRKRKKSQLI